MITRFNTFQKIDESTDSKKYVDIKKQYNSLGEYVEFLHDNIGDESVKQFSIILGEFLKIPTKKYNTNNFKEDDIVLIEYWYNDLLLPVKIIKKDGRKYHISFDIAENSLQKAPEQIIKKEDIVDHYRKNTSNLKEKNIDTNFRISTAVNLMNAYDQMLLVDKLMSEFKIDEKVEFKERDIKSLKVLGKSGFNSFQKILTALNLPNIDINIKSCPNDFFIMYVSENINKERLIKILNRFKSMTQIGDIVNETQSSIKIYFGIKADKNNISMEYGLIEGDNKIIVGNYKLSKRLFEELRTSSSKVLNSLRSQLSNIDKPLLIKLMKIKNDITEFSPGYFHKKSNPYIEDKLLIQGYHGTGNWEKGTITSESLKEIDNTFKKWARTKKWFKDVQYKISTDKFWIVFTIKLK